MACSPSSPKPEAAPAKSEVASKSAAPVPAPVAPAKDNAAQPALPAGHPPIDAAAGAASDVTPSGQVRQETIANLQLAVPTEWTRGQPSSGMRLAEFSIPGPGGAASLAVFRFPGGAGTVDANIERWVGQFKNEDGSKPTPIIAKREAANLKVTSVDVGGSFAGSNMPGAPAQPALTTARMFGLIVEGDGDPYFLKLVGAKTTLDRWAPSWEKLAGSVSVASAAPATNADAKAVAKP